MLDDITTQQVLMMQDLLEEWHDDLMDDEEFYMRMVEELAVLENG